MKINFEYNESGASHLNEDAYGYVDNVAWVIDGATEMFKNDYISINGDVAWVVNEINDRLKKQNTKLSLRVMLKNAINDVFKAAININQEIEKIPQYELPSYSIAMVKLNKSYMEYLVIGDCSIFIDSTQVPIITDLRLKEFHEMIVKVKKRYSKNNVMYNKEVKRMCQFVRKQMNIDKGYWIGSLDSSVVKHSIIGEINYGRSKKIMICSDGFWPNVFEYKLVEFDIEDVFDEVKIQSIITEQRIKENLYKEEKGRNISDDLTVLILESED